MERQHWPQAFGATLLQKIIVKHNKQINSNLKKIYIDKL